jgi:murein DD-endopeptidase MepM/ murein hydrolase activator NlpD
LRHKAAALNSQIAVAKRKIAIIKQEQIKRRAKLTDYQQALQESQTHLHHATQKLSQTRSALVVAREEHQQAVKRQLAQKKRMEARILAQYEAGDPSYLEVALKATDFNDFTERADMTEAIAEHDQSLLKDLLASQRALARKTEVLRQKTAEEASARNAVMVQRQDVALKTQVAFNNLKAADAERASVERELAAFVQASANIAAMMQRVQRSGVRGGAYAGTFSGNLLCPVSGARITCPFGPRIHPITHRPSFHEGIDLGCPGGTPIHAAATGRVVLAGWYGPYGQAVIIDHGSGISTLYGHTMTGTLRVHVGQIVQRGQVIAEVDSTGLSTGNHLHFGKYVNGRAVNPL